MKLSKIAYIILLLLFSFHLSSQDRFAIGVSYNKITDSDQATDYLNGLTTDYQTKREYISCHLLYSLTERLKFTTSLGVSIYNSSVTFNDIKSPYETKASISEPSLLLAEQVKYDILKFAVKDDILQFNISPFIGIEYNQSLKKGNKTGGFSDLKCDDAENWMNEYKLPALSYETEIPNGIFSVSCGLSLECVISKFGLFFDVGYSQAIFGHSKIDIDYITLQNGELQNDVFESKDSGLIYGLGVRYYLK